MRYKLFIVLSLSVFAGSVQAQIQNPGANSGVGGAGSVNITNPTSQSVVSACNGVIDLSKGCVLPMLGGAP